VLIPQSKVGLLEKFGKYQETLKAGLHYINPCSDRILTVDLKTNVMDLKRQVILTKVISFHFIVS
jgi:erythrocyte band 7 integral membrane protein